MNAKALDVAATVLTPQPAAAGGFRGGALRGGGARGGAQLHGGRKAKSSQG